MSGETIKKELDLKRYKRSPNFTTIYTNNVNFAHTPVDVQMVCSRVAASMDKDSELVEEIATIIMTPQHAKAVLEALQGNIKAFEATHGEIKMPHIEPLSEQRRAIALPKERKVIAQPSKDGAVDLPKKK